jgi:uncharacterized membrane protein
MVNLSQRKQAFLEFIKIPQNAFVFLAGIFGFIFVFLVPPLQVYDERAHFFQAYAVSNFDFIPSPYQYLDKTHYGAELPKNVFIAGEVLISVAGDNTRPFPKGLYKEYIFQPLDPLVKDHREIGTTYSPVVYIPQAIGITIGKIFEASPLVMIWLGRLMNLFVWLVLIFMAIKVIPFGKWFVVALALNPLTVFLSASLSADVLTVALAFLFFAIVSKFIVQKEGLDRKKILIIAGVLSLLVLTKPTNIIFAFLLLAIPMKKIKSKLRYVIIIGGTIVFVIALGLLWNHLISTASEVNGNLLASGRMIDSSAQLSQILHNPLSYLKVLIMNYVVIPPGYPGDSTFFSWVGSLGWGETLLPLWSVVLYIATIFVTLLYIAGRGPVFTSKQKIILLTILLLYAVACITAMYLYFTGLGQPVILGVQGRYFIPSLILLGGILTARKKILLLNEGPFSLIIIGILTLLLSITALTIYTRYY